MKKLSVLIVILVAIGGLLLWQSTKSEPSQPVAVYNESVPDAWDKIQVEADKSVAVVDATSTQEIGGAFYLLVGKTVTVTAKDYYFVVTPLRNKTKQVVKLYSPGEKVTLTENDEYAVLIFESASQLADPVGRTMIIKTDEAGLKKLAEPDAQEGTSI